MIEKIKDVLSLNEEVKLEQIKLENGTVIEAESFEKGKEVFIVTDDEKVAMPVGEYILEDSKLLVIEEEGLIADVREVSDEVPSEESEEEMEEELAEEADVADWKGMEKRIKNLEDAIADIKAEEDLKEELSAIEMGNNLTVELSKEVPTEVEAVLSEPSAEPIVSNPESFKELSKFKIGSNRKANTMDRVFANLK
jgi:hypothetical protein